MLHGFCSKTPSCLIWIIQFCGYQLLFASYFPTKHCQKPRNSWPSRIHVEVVNMGKQGSHHWGMSVVPPKNAHLPTETGIPPAISWSTPFSSWLTSMWRNPSILSIIFPTRSFSFFFLLFQMVFVCLPIGRWRSLDFSTEHWPNGPMARIRASDSRPSLLCRQRGLQAAWLLPVGGASEKNPLGFGEDHDETSNVEEKSDVFCVFFGKIDPPNI